MSVAADPRTEFLDEIRRIATEIARPNADAVDREARFPREAVDALRESGALAAFVPTELGGGGHDVATISAACFELGQCCAATGMVFAMHQLQVGTIVRHLESGPWFEGYLRELAESGRLIASVTSEIGTGGDMGRSIAALSPDGDGVVSFEKQAPTVSYGAQADDLLLTLRRAPDAEESDQVLALTRSGDFSLEPAGTWDTLGMRGTCSPGFVVRGGLPAEQVLGAPFATVMNQSFVPLSHVLWSHVWLGIATDAFERARAFVRAAAKRSGGGPVPAAAALSRVMGELSMLRAEVRSALAEFVAASAEPGRPELGTMRSILRFNNLKLSTSEQAPRVCAGVLEVIGIMGYKNDSPFGVGRHLRDSLSARLMVANERIHQTDAGLLLIAKEV